MAHSAPVRRRWWAGAAVLVLLTGGFVVRLFVHPPTDADAGARADAVVVLAGDATARLRGAVRLAETGAGVLAISVDGGRDNAPARALCDDAGDLEVHCFTATESDTRSEARALAELVRRQEWTRIAVVTNSYHIVRAGMLIRRCTDADVAMVEARADMSLERWAVAVVRESGGLVAAVGRGC
jgi:uncharacterized SAM-binding protein YcdF (DUF218 family)